MSIALVQEVLAELSVENKRDEILETISFYIEKQSRTPLIEMLDDDHYERLRADILRILV